MESPWGKNNWNNNNKNNFDDIFNMKMPKFFKELPNNIFKLVIIVISILAAIIIFSGVFQVEQGEEAIVLRFGKYNRMASPGLNYHIPFPFEQIIKMRVQKSRRIEVGYSSYNKNKANQESSMLTGDANIIDIKCDVMWHVKDLKNFAFSIANPMEIVKSASQSSLREIISETPISAVLSDQKHEIAKKIEHLIQNILDKYNAGIEIERVELLAAEPPQEVVSSYRDVQNAKADKEHSINQAMAYANDILPRARGEGEKILQEAYGYQKEVTSKAKGDAERFSLIYNEYKNYKHITKKRIYLEAIEQILSNSDKIITNNDSGVLKHLPINKILKQE